MINNWTKKNSRKIIALIKLNSDRWYRGKGLNDV